MKDLCTYRCHKSVKAARIASVEFREDASATIAVADSDLCIETKPGWAETFRRQMPDDNPDLGYFVEYDDGYQSWSPTDRFEAGYTLDSDPTGDPIEAAFVEVSAVIERRGLSRADAEKVAAKISESVDGQIESEADAVAG